MVERETSGNDCPSLAGLVYLSHQGVQEVLFLDGTEHIAPSEEDAPTLPPGDAEVRLSRLAGTVHHAAHDGHLNRLTELLQALLHGIRQADEIDLAAATAWTTDHDRAVLAEVEGFENFVARLHLFDGVGSQRDANGISNAHVQERPDADGPPDGAGPGTSRLLL